MAAQGLVHGPLGANCVHLCVDMQRLFAAGSPWAVPWLERVLPQVDRLCAEHPERTIFTRFVPVRRAGEGRGTWQRFYEQWSSVTSDEVGADMIRLTPELERHVPPATVLDKTVYSPWTEGRLDRLLAGSSVDSVIISGGETDVCVLATALGAIDRGLRVVLAVDALCSSSDETHDALMTLYLSRFSHQLEAAETEEIVANWHA